jgi:hypothetical protein
MVYPSRLPSNFACVISGVVSFGCFSFVQEASEKTKIDIKKTRKSRFIVLSPYFDKLYKAFLIVAQLPQKVNKEVEN